MFWLIAVLLLGLGIFFIAAPLLVGSRRDTGVERRDMNLRLYRERVAELEAAPETEQQEQLILEAQRELLGDTSQAEAPAATVGGNRKLFIGAAALLPLFAVLFYTDLGLGRGALPDVILTEQLISANMTDYRQLAAAMATRVEQKPGNTDMQFLLARLLTNLGEFDQPVKIYTGLLEQFPGDPNLAVHHAEALFLLDGRKLTGRVQVAIETAMRLSPHNTNLLELQAIAAIEAGDHAAALAWFERLLATGVTGQRAELVRSAMQGLRQPAPAPGDKMRALQVRVAVGPGVNLPPESKVFVYARAWDGPPMPLAIQKLTLAHLPVTVRLDESMAMMPGARLADFNRVQVIARVSSRGEAASAPGDYEARTGELDITGEEVQVNLLITEQLVE